MSQKRQDDGELGCVHTLQFGSIKKKQRNKETTTKKNSGAIALLVLFI